VRVLDVHAEVDRLGVFIRKVGNGPRVQRS
jgi:hypothetical protein